MTRRRSPSVGYPRRGHLTSTQLRSTVFPRCHMCSFVAQGPGFGVVRAKQYPVQGGGLGYGEQSRTQSFGRLEESIGPGTSPVAVGCTEGNARLRSTLKAPGQPPTYGGSTQNSGCDACRCLPARTSSTVAIARVCSTLCDTQMCRLAANIPTDT